MKLNLQKMQHGLLSSLGAAAIVVVLIMLCIPLLSVFTFLVLLACVCDIARTVGDWRLRRKAGRQRHAA